MNTSVKHEEHPNPRLHANPISKLIFWWLGPLFYYGKNHDLEVKDLHKTLPNDLSEKLTDELEKNWKLELDAAHQRKRKPKLLTAIRKTFMWSYVLYGGWVFLSAFLRILQPYTLGLLINYFAPSSSVTQTEAYIYATAVIVMAAIIALLDNHTAMVQMEMGMRLRIATSSLIYRKILRLSRASANKTASGKIINLLSNDVARFDQVFSYLHMIWIMPIQGAMIAYLIWQSVQMATLAGIILITLQTIPVQGYMGKVTSKLRAKIALRTDERVRLMSEIIAGVQVIKMYTWEKPFEQLVSLARKYEIDIVSWNSYIRGITRASLVFTERTTLYFTVLAYVLAGGTVTADKIFSMAQYFNRLQSTMASHYPLAVTFASEAAVSVRRLQKFLLLEENYKVELPQIPSEKISVVIKNVSASWDKETIANTLDDLNTTIQCGKMCAVVGPVGAGKSSFLQLLLGELQPSQGHVTVGESVSYASQEPWLFAGSVRSNILFGQEYDEVRYREVVRACSLVKDFIQLPQGDKTLVGDRGTLLSGGQRARINLARAVYRKADIYLFDDPLSAVDTKVGKDLFEGCFKHYLAGKTRILVTHQVQYLRDVDFIIMLYNGKIRKQGSYNQFDQDDFKLLNMHDSNEDSKSQTGGDDIATIADVNYGTAFDEDEEEPKETEELIAKGDLSKSLFAQYFKAGGYWNLLPFILFLVLGQLGSSGSDYWVAHWTKQEEQKSKIRELREAGIDTTNITAPSIFGYSQYFDNDTALWIYGIFIIGCVVFTTARNLMFYKICMNASKSLHNLMFTSLLKAPMKFFDNNPAGRILNRFSKDIGSIDELLPMAMIDAIQVFAVMVGILLQVIIINWWTILPMLVMALFYWKVSELYLATVQDIKRLEGTTKSPVYSHVSASLNGLATIRSAGKQGMLKREFDHYQDVHTSANSLLLSTSAAFSVWMDAITIVFVAIITYSFIVLKDDSTFAGNVGLAISQILILCGMLQHGLRQTTEMIAQMTSVERVLQFTKLDKEGPFESDVNSKPPATWPARGQIKFEKTSLRYSDDAPPVLKSLNFVIEPGMKVGIVGRTGAGKSSLITALFNLVTTEGTITIDGIDTKKIGLHDLRSKISIIPQEPMLFSATLRDNLDPFHQYEDEQLWSALEEVELKSHCQSLDYLVSQGGTNFSAGQRQLLCLARAIVRNNRILVLDEATANVDPATDALVQRTIRDKFKDCTVLTIAHRLNTVMDSDRILVMDHGEVVEYDHPHLLFQKNDGYLTNMANETGQTMANKLRRIAAEAYNRIPRIEEQRQEQSNGNCKIKDC